MPILDYPLGIKDIWAALLRLYCKVFSGVWFLGGIVGALVNVSLFLSLFYLCKTNIPIVGNVVCVVVNLIIVFLNIYLMAVILHRANAIDEVQGGALMTSLSFVNKKYSTIVIGVFLASFLGVLGTGLFVVPGIYLTIAFFMLQPLILFDNKDSFSALRDSCGLVWGNWWRTCAVIFPVMFINYLLGFAVQFAVIRGTAWYVIMGANMLVTMLFLPLLGAAVLVQFRCLKLRYINKHKALLAEAIVS
ncbi:MAG: hypothetical protein ACD_21C00122G0007 [uncultured bacterium]|nr:MAG: hypothetical protein ACD_21C00122G0007 [uncultured bacterium]